MFRILIPFIVYYLFIYRLSCISAFSRNDPLPAVAFLIPYSLRLSPQVALVLIHTTLNSHWMCHQLSWSRSPVGGCPFYRWSSIPPSLPASRGPVVDVRAGIGKGTKQCAPPLAVRPGHPSVRGRGVGCGICVLGVQGSVAFSSSVGFPPGYFPVSIRCSGRD